MSPRRGSSTMTKQLVRLRSVLATERGQGALEYVGILAVVALVVAAVATAFSGVDVGAKVTESITKILSGTG